MKRGRGSDSGFPLRPVIFLGGSITGVLLKAGKINAPQNEAETISYKDNKEFAKKEFVWNAEKTRLIQKSDGMVLAEVVKIKDVWVAHKYNPGKPKDLGRFEHIELARPSRRCLLRSGIRSRFRATGYTLL